MSPEFTATTYIRNVYRMIHPAEPTREMASSPMAPALQIGRMDIPANVETEWNDWYNGVYIPNYETVPGVRSRQAVRRGRGAAEIPDHVRIRRPRRIERLRIPSHLMGAHSLTPSVCRWTPPSGFPLSRERRRRGAGACSDLAGNPREPAPSGAGALTLALSHQGRGDMLVGIRAWFPVGLVAPPRLFPRHFRAHVQQPGVRYWVLRRALARFLVAF